MLWCECMSLCKGHRATHNKILLSVIWHGIVLSFNFSFSFFHQSYKIVLAIFNFLEKSQFQFSILFLVCFSNAIDPLCRWHCFFLLLIGWFQMLQEMWYIVFILNTSSPLLCGRFSLAARNYLKKLSTSYFNASSEVTKEDLYQFFYLGNKINMWRNWVT